MKTSLHSIKLKNKIWQDATYAIHCTKQTENMKTYSVQNHSYITTTQHITAAVT